MPTAQFEVPAPDHTVGRRWMLFGRRGRPAGAGLRPRSQSRLQQRIQKPPTVRVINPPIRTIVRVVGQPSFIEAYERTSIYPKLIAYIKEWKVDIGDKVKKDQPLAYLFVPELEEDHKTKMATVELDNGTRRAGPKDRGRGRCRRQGGQARLKEAKAILDKYPGRGRSLGLGGQAARPRGRAGHRRSPDPARVGQPVEGEHRREWTPPRQPSTRRTPSCSRTRPSLAKA